jgi:DNA polymerase I-like protein with 3'-5' exonuclease and polymerase domains
VPIEAGVCHTKWKVHGTRTGRWSSPLLILPRQKIDENKAVIPGMRDIVTGFNGNWFLDADYKSLELVVVALLAEDQ